MKTRVRTYRLSNDLIDAANARAEADGVSTTDVVRRALVAYLGLPHDTPGWEQSRRRAGVRADDSK